MMRNQMNSPWTKERSKIAARMWQGGNSATDIAKYIGNGISKNAVIGKMHRMGIERGKDTPPETLEKLAEAEIKKLEAHKNSAGNRARRRPQLCKPLAANERPIQTRTTPEAAAPQRRRSPGETPFKTCQWPFGDPKLPGFHFCGAPVFYKSYCKAHNDMAYKTPLYKEKVY